MTTRGHVRQTGIPELLRDVAASSVKWPEAKEDSKRSSDYMSRDHCTELTGVVKTAVQIKRSPKYMDIT
jgi:hypothetical protein